jgi:hypothetical protein
MPGSGAQVLRLPLGVGDRGFLTKFKIDALADLTPVFPGVTAVSIDCKGRVLSGRPTFWLAHCTQVHLIASVYGFTITKAPMVYLTVIALIAASVVYALCRSLRRRSRVLLAAAVFLVPIVSLVIWVMIDGDRAPAGATTIYPAEPETKTQLGPAN